MIRILRPANHQDDLSDADYGDIYRELRDGRTLRQFIELSVSTLSPSWWSQFDGGDKALTRRARNDLRRAVGLEQLPPANADLPDAIAAGAAVAQVGGELASRVILIAGSDDVTVTWNASGPQIVASGDVTPVPAAQPGEPVHEASQRRKERRKAIKVDPDLYEELNAARQIAGLSWPAFLGRLKGE